MTLLIPASPLRNVRFKSQKPLHVSSEPYNYPKELPSISIISGRNSILPSKKQPLSHFDDSSPLGNDYNSHVSRWLNLID